MTIGGCKRAGGGFVDRSVDHGQRGSLTGGPVKLHGPATMVVVTATTAARQLVVPPRAASVDRHVMVTVGARDPRTSRKRMSPASGCRRPIDAASTGDEIVLGPDLPRARCALWKAVASEGVAGLLDHQ